MSEGTLTQLEGLVGQLTFEQQIIMVERLAHRLRQTVESRQQPRDCTVSGKGSSRRVSTLTQSWMTSAASGSTSGRWSPCHEPLRGRHTCLVLVSNRFA